MRCATCQTRPARVACGACECVFYCGDACADCHWDAGQHHATCVGGVIYGTRCAVTLLDGTQCPEPLDDRDYGEQGGLCQDQPLCRRHCAMYRLGDRGDGDGLVLLQDDEEDQWVFREALSPQRVKREREREEGQEELDDPLAQLERLLIRARAACRLLDERHLGEGDVHRSLAELGVACISVDSAHADRVKRAVGVRVAETFPLLSADVKRSIQREHPSFEPFSAEWKKRSVKETGMALKSSQMPNMVPLLAAAQDHFRHPLLGTVHMQNPLLALAPIDVWEVLAQAHPQLHPRLWFTPPLHAANRPRCQVSEDGFKVAVCVKYGATPLHYDGQPERVQIIFTTDEGPVRLFAVPGSGRPEAQRLICEILGVPALQEGFKSHEAAFKQHPALSRLLYRYGVCVPRAGVLAFRTRVWHYEACIAAPADPQQPGYVDTAIKVENISAKTPEANVFRVYCGVVAVRDNLRDTLIRHAYLRERGWAMEAFTHSNRGNPLFVAEKGSQAADRATYAEKRPAWDELKRVLLAEMKPVLRGLSAERLALYGLTPADVAAADDAILSIEGSGDKRQREELESPAELLAALTRIFERMRVDNPDVYDRDSEYRQSLRRDVVAVNYILARLGEAGIYNVISADLFEQLGRARAEPQTYMAVQVAHNAANAALAQLAQAAERTRVAELEEALRACRMREVEGK